ncbi:unnamed protein product [Mucor hiemalis]
MKYNQTKGGVVPHVIPGNISFNEEIGVLGSSNIVAIAEVMGTLYPKVEVTRVLIPSFNMLLSLVLRQTRQFDQFKYILSCYEEKLSCIYAITQ